MAQDLRKLFRENQSEDKEQMAKGHEQRFLSKLDKALPNEERTAATQWWKIAASVVILLGLGFGGYKFMSETPEVTQPLQEVAETNVKTMGDISPDLKKVEDYYLASINLELSKVKITEDNKEIFDGYINRLQELQAEYNNLNVELTKNGPNPLTIDALINNLKLRLNLLLDLQEQLKLIGDPEGIDQTSI